MLGIRTYEGRSVLATDEKNGVYHPSTGWNISDPFAIINEGSYTNRRCDSEQLQPASKLCSRYGSNAANRTGGAEGFEVAQRPTGHGTHFSASRYANQRALIKDRAHGIAPMPHIKRYVTPLTGMGVFRIVRCATVSGRQRD